MDQRFRTLARCGLTLAMMLPAVGCRSTRSEVPPGRSLSGQGIQPPPGSVGFSSAPNPTDGFSAVPGGGVGQYGTPAPGNSAYGAPTANGYGPPGSSTLAAPVTGPASALPGPSADSPPIPKDLGPVK